MIGLAVRPIQEVRDDAERVEALSRLHDIVLPAPVDMTPQTIGWTVLGALLIVLLVWGTIQAIRRYRRNRYRREALTELDRLQGLSSGGDGRVAALREVPVLVKRTALCAWPRETVADLAGNEWLRFLASTGGGTAFDNGAGRLLLEADYGPPGRLAELSGEDADLLFGAARDWIRGHRA